MTKTPPSRAHVDPGTVPISPYGAHEKAHACTTKSWEIDVVKCDECSSAVQVCERCDGAGRKRWSGECSYCRGTGQTCMKNGNHRW